ncbi:aspartic proteinase nepenthesin-1-like [Panicum miliaceum]|uniref:Aspartic proteinase nepenthesin-1-like n=1 Tax=Panicum miliaceum TaxID=4540 RepID=A0A3L6RZ89_PANMI|nr:aspartic proteinase nepenthesin-1-like [Panicum miliaceum]
MEEELRLPGATPSRCLGLDLCFILPEGVGMDRVYVLTVSLSFDGRWPELERNRLFVEDGRTMCLMVGKTSEVSIQGNFPQQNMQVLYNPRRGRSPTQGQLQIHAVDRFHMDIDLILYSMRRILAKLHIGY